MGCSNVHLQCLVFLLPPSRSEEEQDALEDFVRHCLVNDMFILQSRGVNACLRELERPSHRLSLIKVDWYPGRRLE